MKLIIDPQNGGLTIDMSTRAFANIKAELLADSIAVTNNRRLFTARLTFPRTILAELLTHRWFSRNSASSRAVPVIKIIKQVWNNSAETCHWGSKKAGMQAGAELTGWRKWLTRKIIMTARFPMCGLAWIADKLGAHKQVINRMLEPWIYTNVILSGTEFVNWNSLRVAAYAEPNIAVLAYKLREAMIASTPKRVNLGQWHIPRTVDDLEGLDDLTKCDLAIGRCAAESYYNFDKDQDQKVILERTNKLRESKHMSPLEHCATPLQGDMFCGNFRGWEQTRKRTPGEFAETKPWVEVDSREEKLAQLGGAEVQVFDDDGKLVVYQDTSLPKLSGILKARATYTKDDAHAVRASEYFGIPLFMIDEELREMGKRLNFMTRFGLAGPLLYKELEDLENPEKGSKPETIGHPTKGVIPSEVLQAYRRGGPDAPGLFKVMETVIEDGYLGAASAEEVLQVLTHEKHIEEKDLMPGGKEDAIKVHDNALDVFTESQFRVWYYLTKYTELRNMKWDRRRHLEATRVPARGAAFQNSVKAALDAGMAVTPRDLSEEYRDPKSAKIHQALHQLATDPPDNIREEIQEAEDQLLESTLEVATRASLNADLDLVRLKGGRVIRAGELKPGDILASGHVIAETQLVEV